MKDSTRRTIRTGVQLALDVALLLPVAVVAVGAEATAWGGALIVVGAGITKLMNTPKVERFLKRWAPWLARDPNRDEV